MADTFASLLQDAGVTVSECYVDVTFMEYDSVGEITVPEEAVSEAANTANGELDLPDGDGSYESNVTPAEPVVIIPGLRPTLVAVQPSQIALQLI